MKGWQVTLGGTLVMVISGIVMFLWASTLKIPIPLQFSDYIFIYDQYFGTSQAGTLFTGFGGRLLICTLLIYQLEKKLEHQITIS